MQEDKKQEPEQRTEEQRRKNTDMKREKLKVQYSHLLAGNSVP
jgi:hypothetical protein